MPPEVSSLTALVKPPVLIPPLQIFLRLQAEEKGRTSFSEEKEAKRLWRWGHWDRDCR